MITLLNDIKYTLRRLLKSPGFTAIALITLAIGIGATTAIVSVVKIAVFDPLPVSHPYRLLQLGHVGKEGGWFPGIYFSNLRDAQRQTNLFTLVAAYSWDELTLPGEDFPESVPGMWVTTEFFRLWNLRPLLGRMFTGDEGQPGKDDVLVISHHFWKRKFGGDPAIIGRTVLFQERPMTVVGVMPPHFVFPNANYEYWRPVQYLDPTTSKYGSILQHGPNLRVIAETQPGVELSEVQAFLDVLTRRVQQDQAPMSSMISLQARGLREMFIAPEVNRTLGLLLGAIMFVLLIAVANVANLQSARMETRRQELATRAALGANRARLFRQLLTESLLLAAFGGAAGLAVSVFGLDLLQKLIPANLPRIKPITLNLGVLGIASGVTLATGLLFGLAPALYGWRSNLSEVLKLGTAKGTRDQAHGKFSQALIVGQLALVFVLLAGAGLMIRSVIGLLRVNPDLDAKHVVRVYFSITDFQNRHYDPDPTLNRASEATFAFFADALQRVATIPGVIAAGAGIEGGKVEASAVPGSLSITLKKDWIGVGEANPLRVLRAPLKQGHWLVRSDMQEGIRRVLVNETAAGQLWPGEAAVGKLFWAREWGTDIAYEVVGVVGDTLDYEYNDRVTPQPTFYRAMQKEFGVLMGGTYLVFHAAVDPITLYKPIGQALKTAGADLEQPRFINLHESLLDRMTVHRALIPYLSIFAAAGVFMAAVGIYGLLAYSVVRRTREIGIRMALGAQKTRILTMVLKQGLVLLNLGLIIGVLCAIGLTRFLTSYLFEVSAMDPVTFILVPLLITTVSVLACYIPARRAAKIDPMEALRYE